VIPLATALTYHQTTVPPRAEIVLTDEEETALDFADSCIESAILKHFNGDLFHVHIPADAPQLKVAPLKVLEALKRRYEEGGWTVGLLPVAFDARPEEFREFQFVLSPGMVKKAESVEAPKVLKGLPNLTGETSNFIVAKLSTKRLLVRMPTRGRPEQALRVLGLYRELAGMPIQMEVVIDEDDPSMLDTRVLQRLNALDCVVTVGAHRNKIEAVNGGRLTEWDILVLASDDMVPVSRGWAVDVVDAMEQHFPHLDGLVYFSDGYAHERCITLPIMGRRLWQQFGSVVYTKQYKSLWCDLEQTELLRAMGRLAYVDKILIEHRHPVTRKARTDALYDHNGIYNDADRQVYEWRAKFTRPRAQYAFDAPPQYLSILIATVPNRRQRLELLLDHLWAQILALEEPRMVEIVVDADGGTIGEKRQRMLEKARGHFVVAVDDDDFPVHTYVAKIIEVIRQNPDVDCLSFTGVMTTRGERPEVFKHSIAYEGWYTKGGVHYRTPNHLSPIRRTLALEAGFTSMVFGEDHDHSKRVRPLLKTEASTGDVPLYLYWFGK
jgi:hypothetical protein